MTAESGPLPIVPDVWRVSTPMPFRPRRVHAYLARLERGRWMLVDGGINTEEAWGALDSAVRGVAGGWDALVLHVVTHMHLDHVGLAARTREASGAPLAMGSLDAERAAHAAADPEEEARYRQRLLETHGAPPELTRSVQSGRAAADPLGSFVPCDYPLPLGIAPVPQAEGWEAVWTPGHTAGHVALLRRSDAVLLAGDALLPTITPTIGVNRQREDPVGDYLATLARLEELEPSRALAGHGEPMEHPAARIRELRLATREETERVAALLSAHPATAWEVTRARYAERDLPPSALMLALRETLAHLQHLAAAGRAERDEADGVERFRST
jgi:glyoxylase-like metal-dependent hydrolase (beta-lactamase superfamily II)